MTAIRVCLAAMTLAVLGCSGGNAPRCHAVRGRVVLADQPVAEAQVVFHPLAAQPREAPKPLGFTDAEGQFELTTLKAGDGAQVGDYAITVELREPRWVGEELVREGPHLLPARYADPRTTELRYTVVAGKNAVPPLVLNSP